VALDLEVDIFLGYPNLVKFLEGSVSPYIK